MRITVFFIKFLLLGAFFIISNQNLALIDEGNRNLFIEEYKGWIFGIADHVGSLTGYIVEVEWLPDIIGTNRESNNEVGEGPRYSRVKR